MLFKKYKWFKIADSEAELVFSKWGIAVAEVNGRKICLGKKGDHIYGFAYNCPHAGGLFSEGYIDDDGLVVCPIHRYKFDIKNGRNNTGEGYHLKTYPIEIRPDGVYVGEVEGGLMSWLSK